MRRMIVLFCCLWLQPQLHAQEEDMVDPPAPEAEYVEWAANHFPHSCTDTFELSGEWIEYVDDDGLTRFAATGDGAHGVLVFQVDGIVSESVAADTEVYWAVDEDGVITDLTIEYGSTTGEWLVFTPDPWNGGQLDVSEWKESKCSKREKRTKKWTCQDTSSKCIVSIKTNSSGNSTRNGDCDAKHVFEYDRTTNSLTFWIE